MNDLKSYLITVTAAAIMCSCACTLVDENNGLGKAVRMVAGLVLVIAVVQPLAKLRPMQIDSWIESLSWESQSASLVGESYSKEMQIGIIKDRTQEYILDKAAQLDCEIQAEVMISPQMPYAPEKVRITGNVSPYARTQLAQCLESELGIAKEDQIWNCFG